MQCTARFLKFCSLSIALVLGLQIGGLAQGAGSETLRGHANNFVVAFDYPVTDHAAIDAELKQWAEQEVQSFAEDFAESGKTSPYELKGSFQLLGASPRVLSVVWNVWSYTGGAHGNLDIVTFLFDRESGAVLEFQDIFEDMEEALRIVSQYTLKQLAASPDSDLAKIKDGTAPDLDNFASFALTPDGIRVYFQPYQVGPWSDGVKEVDIALEELLSAGPHLFLWGK